MVKLLLRNGANIEAKNCSSRTPLFYALNKPEIMKLLLEKGANIDAKDDSQRNAVTRSSLPKQTRDSEAVAEKKGRITRVDRGNNGIYTVTHSSWTKTNSR